MAYYTCIIYVICVLSGRFSILPVIGTVTTCNAKIPSHYNNQNLELILEIALIPPSHLSDVETSYFERKENIFIIKLGLRHIYYNVFNILIL